MSFDGFVYPCISMWWTVCRMYVFLFVIILVVELLCVKINIPIYSPLV